MTTPEIDYDIESEGYGRLTDAFRGLPNVTALLRSQIGWLARLQYQIHNVLRTRVLDDPLCAGVAVDMLGALTGELRGGRSDAEYKQALKVAMRARRSLGTPEDLLALAQLSGYASHYLEDWPATIRFEVFGTYAAAMGRFARIAKPAGVRLGYVYSAHPQAEVFHWQDVASIGPDTANNVWASTTGLTPASLPLSSIK